MDDPAADGLYSRPGPGSRQGVGINWGRGRSFLTRAGRETHAHLMVRTASEPLGRSERRGLPVSRPEEAAQSRPPGKPRRARPIRRPSPRPVFQYARAPCPEVPASAVAMTRGAGGESCRRLADRDMEPRDPMAVVGGGLAAGGPGDASPAGNGVGDLVAAGEPTDAVDDVGGHRRLPATKGAKGAKDATPAR